MPAPTLSKSRFTSGLQCHRQLWWRCYDGQAPELIPPPARRALFGRGHRVGAVACEHVPGGFQIPFSGRQRKRAVEATREAEELINRFKPTTEAPTAKARAAEKTKVAKSA